MLYRNYSRGIFVKVSNYQVGNLSLKGCVGKTDFAPVDNWQSDSKMEGNSICRC
jgi:AMMECR1 domain-containing protein